MITKLSTKGQVVLPGPIREKMGLQPGDQLRAAIEEDRIVLTPSRKPRRKARIVKDPLTGFPMLTAGKGAPKLTNKEVAGILAEYP
jgi:AbrB family looped-hinge helix DNA binding protein